MQLFTIFKKAPVCILHNCFFFLEEFFTLKTTFSLIMSFSSVQSLSCVRLFATPWTTACQASLSFTNCHSLPKAMSTESVMPSNYLILFCPLLLLTSIFPSITVFSNKSALCIRWPIWEMQIKTMRSCCTPIRIAKIQSIDNTKSWQ